MANVLVLDIFQYQLKKEEDIVQYYLRDLLFVTSENNEWKEG